MLARAAGIVGPLLRGTMDRHVRKAARAPQ
jgi:hypothetical protein